MNPAHRHRLSRLREADHTTPQTPPVVREGETRVETDPHRGGGEKEGTRGAREEIRARSADGGGGGGGGGKRRGARTETRRARTEGGRAEADRGGGAVLSQYNCNS